MTDAFKNALNSVVTPLFRRPPLLQVAALCSRMNGAQKEVLLITSRRTGRWIMPKGWPIDGLDAAGAAAQEAWEEAGVKPGKIGRDPIGSFAYDKVLDNGVPAPVQAQVFPIEVKATKDDFPEADERDRKWVTPQEAATMVCEPELKTLLLDL